MEIFLKSSVLCPGVPGAVLTGPVCELVPVLVGAGEVVPGVAGHTGDRVLTQPHMLATQPTASPPPAGDRGGGD